MQERNLEDFPKIEFGLKKSKPTILDRAYDLMDNRILVLIFLIAMYALVSSETYALATKADTYGIVIKQAELCRQQVMQVPPLYSSCEVKLGELLVVNYKPNTYLVNRIDPRPNPTGFMKSGKLPVEWTSEYQIAKYGECLKTGDCQ